jgi:hypothetical protein
MIHPIFRERGGGGGGGGKGREREREKSSVINVKKRRCIHRLFPEQEVELVVVCIVTKFKQILSQSAVTTSHNA